MVNAETTVMFALAIADGGSRQIQVSTVFPNLEMAVIEEALKRSQTENDGAINRWLLQQFGESLS